ncbi:unnamed protein product, partial [Iphiclides podalirius]
MLIKFGLSFAAICLCVAFAMPPCRCPLAGRPVCGSNGQTYTNMCFLMCAGLRNPNVTLASRGPCEPTTTSDPTTAHLLGTEDTTQVARVRTDSSLAS